MSRFKKESKTESGVHTSRGLLLGQREATVGRLLLQGDRSYLIEESRTLNESSADVFSFLLPLRDDGSPLIRLCRVEGKALVVHKFKKKSMLTSTAWLSGYLLQAVQGSDFKP